MKVNSLKFRCSLVSRPSSVIPSNGDLLYWDLVLARNDGRTILGILFELKFTFQRHIRSLVSSKVGNYLKVLQIFS